MAKDMLQEWIDRHDELTLEGDEIHHEGHRIGVQHSTSVQFDAEAAPSGTMKALDGEWLIIAGSRTINELDGYRTHTGDFAIRPMSKLRPEVDGPLPDDSY